MESISIVSFIAFFILQLAGAYWHYRVVCKQGRHFGGLWEYLMQDYKHTSVPVFVALLASSLFAASSQTADFVNPELAWAMLRVGEIHLPSIAVAYLTIQGGYAWDSQLNSGNNE
jgi:hypothetical protein